MIFTPGVHVLSHAWLHSWWSGSTWWSRAVKTLWPMDTARIGRRGRFIMQKYAISCFQIINSLLSPQPPTHAHTVPRPPRCACGRGCTMCHTSRASWTGGWLASWLVGLLVDWLAGWLLGWVFGWLVEMSVSWNRRCVCQMTILINSLLGSQHVHRGHSGHARTRGWR